MISIGQTSHYKSAYDQYSNFQLLGIIKDAALIQKNTAMKRKDMIKRTAETVQIIQSKNFYIQREQRYIDALKYINQCRSLAKAKANLQTKELIAFKQTLKELADFNINPVTIPREWNIKHIPNFLRVYFNELMEDHSNFNIMAENLCTAHGYFEYSDRYKKPLYNTIAFLILMYPVCFSIISFIHGQRITFLCEVRPTTLMSNPKRYIVYQK